MRTISFVINNYEILSVAVVFVSVVLYFLRDKFMVNKKSDEA